MSILLGWWVWCCCEHYREPEGVIAFDHDPAIGETVKLSDGKQWRVKSINKPELELTVEPCE